MIAKYSAAHGSNWDEFLPRLFCIQDEVSWVNWWVTILSAIWSRCKDTHWGNPIIWEFKYRGCGQLQARTSIITGRVASEHLKKSQNWQKQQDDKRATTKSVRPGDRVMVYMPKETTGPQRKMACPHFGPYRVIEVHLNGVTVRQVDWPKNTPIRVNQDRISLCPLELPDSSSLGKHRQSCKWPML